MSSPPCPCQPTADPQVVSNAPGLPAITYRVGDFGSFRRALLQALPGESALLGWRPAPGDLGLQVLEWWAYLADVLTFYNERAANESYVRTAQLPSSVRELVALLGYRPRPAIAAVGQLAAIRSAARPGEPVAIPAGMQMANTATPGVEVQTFEAAAATFAGASDVAITPAANPALLGAPSGTAPAVGSLLLRGAATGIHTGDHLVLAPRVWPAQPADVRWALLSVVSIASVPEPGGGVDTRVDVARLAGDTGWMAGATAGGYRLLRALRGATLWNRRDAGTQATAGTLEAVGAVELGPVVRPPVVVPPIFNPPVTNTGDGVTPISEVDAQTLELNMSASVAISPGDLVLIDDGTSSAALGLVTEAADGFNSVPFPDATGLTTPPPPIPIAHTVLTVSTPDAQAAAERIDTAAAVVRFALRDAGTPIPTPAKMLSALPARVATPPGFTVPVGATPVFVEDVGGTGIAATASPAADGALILTATDATPAGFSLSTPLRLLIDLFDVSRGSTVSAERLGTGDAATAGQQFTLKQSPLTYLAQGPGYASTLRITVDGIRWDEVASFYGQASGATVYVVSQRDDGSSEVRFGDGVNGSRLPTGSAVLATYRYGAGAASPPAGRLTTIRNPQPNLAAVHNPVAVSGGADPEKPSDARNNAPASVLTFGRAISADDYSAVAALSPGVARAHAYWTWDQGRQRTLIKVYVGDDDGATVAAANALAGAEDPNRPVLVVAASPIDLVVSAVLVIDAGRTPANVLAAAGAALSDPQAGLFSPASMGIGQALYASEIEAALQVDGVISVRELTVIRDESDLFGSEPVGSADPGEGAFFSLYADNLTAGVTGG